MSRISRIEFYVEQVKLYQRRSTCLRLQVGAIIIRDGRIVSGGYNGRAAGLPHCTPETCSPDKPCTAAVHAEAGAIAFAAKYGIALAGCGMWCSHSPCVECAKLIINAGITSVTYLDTYRDITPIKLLAEANINLRYGP